jgi:hypothetical protein
MDIGVDSSDDDSPAPKLDSHVLNLQRRHFGQSKKEPAALLALVVPTGWTRQMELSALSIPRAGLWMATNA